MGATCCNNSTVTATGFCQGHINAEQQIESTQQGNLEFENIFPQIHEVIKNRKPLFQDIQKQNVSNKIEGIYVGQLSNSLRHDYGIMMYHSGFMYLGNWKNDKKHGVGTMVYENGDVYEGEWANDDANGQGTYIGKEQNIKYVGNWLQGKQHGYGVQQYLDDGSRYEGQFRQNIKHGLGKLIHPNGSYYQGNFLNNIIEGQGVYYGINQKYMGQWKEGLAEGTGKTQWFERQTKLIAAYIGQYKEGQKHGFGEYRWDNNEVYKGNWTKGVANGDGVIVRNNATEQINNQGAKDSQNRNKLTQSNLPNKENADYQKSYKPSSSNRSGIDQRRNH